MSKSEEILENALKAEPSFKLKEGFSDRVLKAIRRKELRNQRKLYIWMALGFLVMFGFGVMLMSMFAPDTLISSGIFDLGDQFNRSIPFAIILGLVIVAIQYLDKKLIKDKYLFS